MEQVDIGPLRHFRFHKVVQNGFERIVKPVQVQGENLSLVLVQLPQGVGFHQFLQRADSARQGDGGHRVFPHPLLPLRHCFGPHHFAHLGMLQPLHKGGQHGHMPASQPHGFSGDGAHRAARAATGNNVIAPLMQALYQLAGRLIVLGVDGAGRGTINDNLLSHPKRTFQGLSSRPNNS